VTFTIATGNEDDRKLALWTLEGIARELPECQLVLGPSNAPSASTPRCGMC
jgi:5-methyltetrahydrofolate--homocysteine methyltransferase